VPILEELLSRHGDTKPGCATMGNKMATIGRNCGSGTKYKKCCLAKDEREATQRRAAAPPPAAPTAPAGWVIEDDGLDDLSNSVVDLVAGRRFEEALAACQRLLDEFPEVVDGLERSAMVHAAMGNHAAAADFYRRVLAFVTHPSRRDQYEDADFYREQLEKEERLTR
jgi:tetratricopeptide (TPR) repeat protein